MSKVAIVENDVITNVVVSPDEDWAPPEGAETILLENLPEGAGPGWVREGTNWALPVEEGLD